MGAPRLALFEMWDSTNADISGDRAAPSLRFPEEERLSAASEAGKEIRL